MGSTREHGYARYKLDGCRCDVCTAAASRYHQIRSRGIADGTWKPFTDATPAVEHARALHAAGLTDRKIAAICGVSHRRVYAIRCIIDPASQRVRPATAAAILSVPVPLGGGL